VTFSLYYNASAKPIAFVTGAMLVLNQGRTQGNGDAQEYD